MIRNKPVKVFFSYAHEDEALRDELAKHLSSLQRQGVISSWHDRQIFAGDKWADKIDTHLDTSQIILLLISSDFMASDYCNEVEMRRALERHEAGEARVIPVILRPVDWEGVPFAKLQALPKDAKPITSWANRDEAFTDVARGIRQAIAGGIARIDRDDSQSKLREMRRKILTPRPRYELKRIKYELQQILAVNPDNLEALELMDDLESAIAWQEGGRGPIKIDLIPKEKRSLFDRSKVFIREYSRAIGVVVGIFAILSVVLFLNGPLIGAILPTPTATHTMTVTPTETPLPLTEMGALTVTPTPWLCPFQGRDDDVILRSLIEAEAEAAEKEDVETINLIFLPTAIVADARGEPSEPASIRYMHKFEEESHRNIQHFDFTYAYLSTTDAIVDTKVTGEWYDDDQQSWRPYGIAPHNYDINRWIFEKVDGCWRISGFTYNLSLVTPIP